MTATTPLAPPREPGSITERLVTRLAGGGAGRGAGRGARRPSRRGFLARATVAGAALATQPWSYVTRPGDAYAAVCGGTDNSCAAGYTVFCCTINDGKNSCPSGTFPGGWWKADNSSFCGGAARYYIDCNADPGKSVQCRCNTDACDHRLHSCNIFRYGQCNTQIHGTTAVVCRQISCAPPWQVYPGACGHSSATDQNTAGHDAPCLHPPAWDTGPLLPAGPNKLAVGHAVTTGQHLTAQNRRTMVSMQHDGRFVVHNNQGLRWEAPVRSVGGYVTLQTDGNLVFYTAAGRALWSTRTNGQGPHCYLMMRNNGNLVLYNKGQVAWQSHTRYVDYVG